MIKRPPFQLMLDDFEASAGKYLQALNELAKNPRSRVVFNNASLRVRMYGRATLLRRMRLNKRERTQACEQLERFRDTFVPEFNKFSGGYMFSRKWFDRLITAVGDPY